MSDELTKVAIVGASGYSGIELVRLLLQHPGVELACVTSRGFAGKALSEVFPRFRKLGVADELKFTEPDVEVLSKMDVEVVVLALPHGVASEYAVPLLEAGLRVIDLSADFRLRSAEVYEEFYGAVHPAPELLASAVYGMPEVRREEIGEADLVASPGCYPTSIILPLVPLLKGGLIDPKSIHTFSMSGTSGAGRNASIAMLFAECSGSVRAYSVPKHRHLSEIEQELGAAAGGEVVISFTPHLIPVVAGIATTTYATLGDGVTEEQVGAALEEAYKDCVFVRLLGAGECADTKHVVGTNSIDIGWSLDERTGRVILTSAEDNLIKGASGQAIQSLNLMFGMPESLGLRGV